MALFLADPAGISFAEELHAKSDAYDQQEGCWDREPAADTLHCSRRRSQIIHFWQKNV